MPGESCSVSEKRLRKCLHFYFYFLDPEFGFLHVRAQSWLPFTIQIYIYGFKSPSSHSIFTRTPDDSDRKGGDPLKRFSSGSGLALRNPRTAGLDRLEARRSGGRSGASSEIRPLTRIPR